mmetsp:Transcript_12888/g.17972  ORF Transcript_12888/g.17972 Transcript_12888/m.17972 type:complete len:792 (+) Transcript_12888:64-2439(+)
MMAPPAEETPMRGNPMKGSPVKRNPMKYAPMKLGAKHGFFIWCVCLVASVLCVHSSMADEVGKGLAEEQRRGSANISEAEDGSVTPAGVVKVPANEPMMPARGQHLMVDLSGSNFDALNDEKKMKQATLNIVEKTGMTLLGINSFKLDPQGVSVVATLAESHLSIHTWPEHGKALIDLFTCGAGFNLQKALPIVVEQYEGDIEKSTYSVLPRGDYEITKSTKHDKIIAQFQPVEIMSVHKYKKKVFEIQSPFQNIQIWDHHDTLNDEYTKHTIRSLFLDGVMQSCASDEEKYHETLVHPAFIASSIAPKRVLIVGGGEGGTLRESLKWKSVEHVTMVDLDAEVIKASRTYLPSFSNCTGFGANICFDDERVELYTEDFIQWFDDHIGNDICDSAKHEARKNKNELYDIIILDLLDTEDLPEGEAWAEHLYSELFFERIACAVNDYGVVVTNFGESPENPYNGGPPEPMTSADQELLEMYTKKIEQIQTMSSFFRHTRVYETPVPAFRADWAFAISMIPDRPFLKTNADDDMSSDEEKIALTRATDNMGINDFEANEVRVNLKLRRGLHEKAYPLEYYDGAIQHTFQYPTGGWDGVYCMNPSNKKICEIDKILFNKNYEGNYFEAKLNDKADATSGIVAKQDIKKGHVSGLYDAATSLKLPSTDIEFLKTFATDSPQYSTFKKFTQTYGFDGGLGGTGDKFILSLLSLHTFANHACDHKPNLDGIYDALPWTRELFDRWNPVAARIMNELDHAVVATRDIPKGEMITDDYTQWDKFSFGKEERLAILKKWVG